MRKSKVADLILRFIGDSPGLGEWEWDDFITIIDKNQEIELIRRRVLEIEIKYPPISNQGWCSEQGINELRKIAHELIEQGRVH